MTCSILNDAGGFGEPVTAQGQLEAVNIRPQLRHQGLQGGVLTQMIAAQHGIVREQRPGVCIHVEAKVQEIVVEKIPISHHRRARKAPLTSACGIPAIQTGPLRDSFVPFPINSEPVHVSTQTVSECRVRFHD